MQGGLRAGNEKSEMQPGTKGAPSDRMHAMTAGDGTPNYAPESSGSGGPSHLDSFFQGSNWTRQDLVTAATVLNTVLFITLVYIEVNR